MDLHSQDLFLSAVSIAEIADGVAKAKREGAKRKAADLSAWLRTVLHLYGARGTPHKACDGCDRACRRSSTSRDNHAPCYAAAGLSESPATGIPCSKYTSSHSSLRARRRGPCCHRAWLAGSTVQQAPIHHRLDRSDIAMRYGRNVRGSYPGGFPSMSTMRSIW